MKFHSNYLNKVFVFDVKKTPLCIAIETGNVEIVKLILNNKKININFSNKV